MNDIKTVELMSLLKNIDNESNLDDYISNTLTSSNDLSLHRYFENLFKAKSLSKSTVIKNADIDRTYGYEILRGDKKPSRDKILQICIGASFSLEETNKSLKLGNVGELYAKVPRDSVIIFCINKKLGIIEINELLFGYGFNILGEE